MPITKLKEIIFERIPVEIFLAHEALGVYMAVANASDFLKQSRHCHVFGIIQRQALDAFVLSLCKLFERPGQKYPNYSIPTALKHFHVLEDKDLPDQIPAKLVEYICNEIDLAASDLVPLKAATAARMICTHFEELCPRTPPRKDKTLDETLDALKVLRDKRVAHHEDHDLVGMTSTDLESAIELFCYAQTFVNIIGYGFFGFSEHSTVQPAQFSPDKSRGWGQMTKMIKEIVAIDTLDKFRENGSEKAREEQRPGLLNICASLWSLIRRSLSSIFNRRSKH